MVALEDADAVAYNRRVILASTIVVFIVSNGSYIARLFARKMSGGRFQAEDWVMGLALPFSYIPAACLLYGAYFLTSKLDSRQLTLSRSFGWVWKA
jgi:hypothetical protein